MKLLTPLLFLSISICSFTSAMEGQSDQQDAVSSNEGENEGGGVDLVSSIEAATTPEDFEKIRKDFQSALTDTALEPIYQYLSQELEIPSDAVYYLGIDDSIRDMQEQIKNLTQQLNQANQPGSAFLLNQKIKELDSTIIKLQERKGSIDRKYDPEKMMQFSQAYQDNLNARKFSELLRLKVIFTLQDNFLD